MKITELVLVVLLLAVRAAPQGTNVQSKPIKFTAPSESLASTQEWPQVANVGWGTPIPNGNGRRCGSWDYHSHRPCAKCALVPRDTSIGSTSPVCTACHKNTRFSPAFLLGSNKLLAGYCLADSWAVMQDAPGAYSGKGDLSMDDFLDLAWALRHKASTWEKWQSETTVLGGYTNPNDPQISGAIGIKVGRQTTAFVSMQKNLPAPGSAGSVVEYGQCRYEKMSAISTFVKIAVLNGERKAANTQSGQRLAAVTLWSRSKSKPSAFLGRKFDSDCCSKIGGRLLTKFAGMGFEPCYVEIGRPELKDNKFWKGTIGASILEQYSKAMSNIRMTF